jgi:hypothetical protein
MQQTNLKSILQILEQLEPIFHAAYPEATAADFERLVSPDFWEVGASGKVYSREFALNVLKNRPSMPDSSNWQTSDYQVSLAGKDVYLLTYVLQQPTRLTRRLTIWQHTENGWQALYHQGTVVTN